MKNSETKKTLKNFEKTKNKKLNSISGKAQSFLISNKGKLRVINKYQNINYGQR